MKMIAPNIAMPMVAPIALETLKTLERKSVSGRIGSTARRLLPDEGRKQRDTGDAEPDDRRRAPRVLRAAPAREQDQRRDAAGQERRAEVVDPVAGRRYVCRWSRKTTIRIASAPIGMLT